MDAKKEILKRIDSLSGSRSGYEVFTDWITCSAITISNAVEINRAVWEAREQRYMETIRRYRPEEQQKFTEMLGLLTMALEDNIEDVLGSLYMMADMGSRATGQFFTPYHIALLTARASIRPKDVTEDHPLIVNEPAVGGGAMIIAAAKVLQDAGVNYQRCMRVIAQDLDYKAVYMCYAQLSLLGIRAKVIQGDALATERPEPEQIFYTPAAMLGI